MLLLLCMQICVGQHTFTYDNVYGSGGGDDAANLYPDCVEPLVEGLFKGYNATVFAYGAQQLQGATGSPQACWFSRQLTSCRNSQSKQQRHCSDGNVGLLQYMEASAMAVCTFSAASAMHSQQRV